MPVLPIVLDNLLNESITEFLDQGFYFSFVLDKSLLLEQALVKLEGWEDTVTIVSSDMRHWSAPEKADILVYIYAH